MNKLIAWLGIKLWALQEWVDSWKPCPKEEMGYTCRHRTLSNGQKECGKWHNYWGADDE